jgi:hypothetical protein
VGGVDDRYQNRVPVKTIRPLTDPSVTEMNAFGADGHLTEILVKCREASRRRRRLPSEQFGRFDWDAPGNRNLGTRFRAFSHLAYRRASARRKIRCHWDADDGKGCR